ncbi:MAG TPA: hypothetical protein VIC00_06625, partial [Candidatus Acidoferrales bacterium]
MLIALLMKARQEGFEYPFPLVSQPCVAFSGRNRVMDGVKSWKHNRGANGGLILLVLAVLF